jgi:signal recognition particle GTPase
MNKRIDELPDEDAIEFSPDLAAAQAEEERKRKAREAAELEDDDDDDFDLLGDDDQDDDGDDPDDSDDDTGSDGDDDDDDDLDDADGDDEDDDVPAAARVPKVKKGEKPKSKAQLRIEELAEKRRVAEKGQYDAELKLVQLEKRLEQLETGGGPTRRAPADLKEPDPKDFEYGAADDDYVNAMVDYKVALKRAEWEEENGKSTKQAKEQALVEHYQDRYTKVQAAGAKKYGEKFKLVEETNFPSELARDLLDSDYGVDISYYLANNIGQLRKVVTMTDAQRAKAIGRLEERFSASASAGKKRSKAPETPGRKAKKKVTTDESRYGPDDQDAFDKAFWGR